MPFCSSFCYMKQILLLFCPSFCYMPLILLYEADSAAILPYAADDAAHYGGSSYPKGGLAVPPLCGLNNVFLPLVASAGIAKRNQSAEASGLQACRGTHQATNPPNLPNL